MQVITIFHYLHACILSLETSNIFSFRWGGSSHCFFVWDHRVTYAPQTAGTLLTFVYLMMNHPEVQRRAQAEIDRVIGRQRLPVFEDRASLPYLDAVLRETMRWYPVAPIGVSKHVCSGFRSTDVI